MLPTIFFCLGSKTPNWINFDYKSVDVSELFRGVGCLHYGNLKVCSFFDHDGNSVLHLGALPVSIKSACAVYGLDKIDMPTIMNYLPVFVAQVYNSCVTSLTVGNRNIVACRSGYTFAPLVIMVCVAVFGSRIAPINNKRQCVCHVFKKNSALNEAANNPRLGTSIKKMTISLGAVAVLVDDNVMSTCYPSSIASSCKCLWRKLALQDDCEPQRDSVRQISEHLIQLQEAIQKNYGNAVTVPSPESCVCKPVASLTASKRTKKRSKDSRLSTDSRTSSVNKTPTSVTSSSRSTHNKKKAKT
jgi:hypothetical protein